MLDGWRCFFAKSEAALRAVSETGAKVTGRVAVWIFRSSHHHPRRIDRNTTGHHGPGGPHRYRRPKGADQEAASPIFGGVAVLFLPTTQVTRWAPEAADRQLTAPDAEAAGHEIRSQPAFRRLGCGQGWAMNFAWTDHVGPFDTPTGVR